MNLEKLATSTAEDFYYIGKRLRAIREELVENDNTVINKKDSLYTRSNLAEMFGITYPTIANLERGGHISITTIKIIIFYYSLGYNPMWILAPDNKFIPKKNIAENLVYQSGVQNAYQELEKKIFGAMGDFKKSI